MFDFCIDWSATLRMVLYFPHILRCLSDLLNLKELVIIVNALILNLSLFNAILYAILENMILRKVVQS